MPGTGARYYLKDHLGSTRAVTDQSNNILATFDYYPFGLLMPDRYSTSNNTNQKFTGKELDENTSQYYFGARYYDAALGRWHSVDPLLNEKTPNNLLEKDVRYLSQSPYNYVHNNPMYYVDPEGKQVQAIKNTVQTFWRGMQNQFAEMAGVSNNKTPKQVNSNRFNVKNPARLAGQQTADVLSNTYYEPYVSISASKADAIGWIPLYLQITATPSGLSGTMGIDVTESAPTGPPFSISAGIFTKYGSPISANDLGGVSIGMTGGSYIGGEFSTSTNLTTSKPFIKLNEINQFGVTLSGSA